jgi:two-component system, NarL family, response regulator LiaR
MAYPGTRSFQLHSLRPIRVMVVDDHARVRQGLRLFLSTCPEMEIVAEAGGGAEALAHFARVLPDVVIMDLRRPGMDSPVVTRLMKRLNPSSQIIALASEVDPDMERRVLTAGALCCVVKDSSAGALVEAIHRARSGEYGDPMTFIQVKTGASA